MTILVVDDQTSVINGILSGVHFSELGIDTVKTATDSQQALAIFETMNIDILMSDIEMPGVNGLELNRIVQEKYPETLRIVLTSHAEFNYAQESVRLACFAYLLQPCPFEDIENCLRTALDELYRRKKRQQLFQLGQLMKTNETELMDRIVINLFASVAEDIDSAIDCINDLGYPLTRQKGVQLLFVDVVSYRLDKPGRPSKKMIHKALKNALSHAGIHYPVLSLVTTNPYRQFVMLLFSATSDLFEIPPESYRRFYNHLRESFPGEEISCYVADLIPLKDVRIQVPLIHKSMNDNIDHRADLHFISEQMTQEPDPTNLAERAERWKTLLESNQKKVLETEVKQYLNSVVNKSSNRFSALCELHQQLTHIFFSYFYDHNIDVGNLFSDAYTYPTYMDGYKDLGSFWDAFHFMMDAVEQHRVNLSPKSDVEKAKSFIAAHLVDPITVNDVANHVNLSPEYFTRLFKHETGQNIKEYITLYKIEVAKDMLERTDVAVGMVAMELGYSNFSHFTQVFKKYENVTPSQYRNMYRERRNQ